MKNGLVVENGTKRWYKDDVLHREDGPPEEWANGSKEWYLHGVELIQPDSFKTIENWFKYLNNNEEQDYQLIHDHKQTGMDGVVFNTQLWRVSPNN